MTDWDPPVLEPGVEIDGEQVLLDSNVEAEGHDFFSLGGFSLSDDDTLLAWSVDVVGDERYTIRVKDLRTGELLPDTVTGTSGGVTWSADATHFFYTTVDDAWRPFRVWRHELGSTDEDVLVHEETDERFFTGVGRTQSERYLVIGSSSKITSEVRVLEADDPEGEFRVVWPRETASSTPSSTPGSAGEDVFLILHNRDALNFELVAVPAAGPYDDATVLIGHRDDVRLEDVDVFARQLVVSYRRDAIARIAVILLDDDAPNGLGRAT